MRSDAVEENFDRRDWRWSRAARAFRRDKDGEAVSENLHEPTARRRASRWDHVDD